MYLLFCMLNNITSKCRFQQKETYRHIGFSEFERGLLIVIDRVPVNHNIRVAQITSGCQSSVQTRSLR